MIRTFNCVAIDFSDRILGGDPGRDSLGQRDEGELIDCLRAVKIVVAIPVEIATNIGQTKQ